MTQKKYEGFTLGMALMDAVPVLTFGASTILLGIAMLKNGAGPLFFIGAALGFFGGLFKVLWKMLVAVRGKDVVWMNKQFRFTLPFGFLLMVLAFVINLIRKNISFAAIGAGIVRFPAVIFFALGLLGMCLMGVLAGKLDPGKAKSNWIEQSVNSLAQIFIFVGILISVII